MDLAQLILATKGDRSYENLARAAGGVPGAKRWHQLATKPILNFPDPPTVRAISTALGVTETVVVMAAARSLGLDVASTDSALAMLLPSRAGQLTPRQVAAVRQVVMSMVEPDDEEPRATESQVARASDYAPAAMEGESRGLQQRAESDRRGEESQDPDDAQ